MGDQENLFKIVKLPLTNSIKEFSNIAKEISKSQNEYFPEVNIDQDKLIYFSCIPWISFTSISNEIIMNKEDSIPRISFGKFIEQLQKFIDEIK
jgi:chloramphenicol O-acetyltransferase type A